MLDKYWLLYDEVPAYLGSLILHPAHREQYIKDSWDKDWVKTLLPKVKTYWEQQYKDKVPVMETEVLENKMENKLKLWHRKQQQLANHKDEFTAFTKAPCVAIKGPAYKWWLQPEQQKTYPNLSRMAIVLLSIPSMSAEPERVFSGARRTITWERMRLGSKAIEHNECLKLFQRIRVKWDKEHLEELRALTSSITMQVPDDVQERESTEDFESL